MRFLLQFCAAFHILFIVAQLCKKFNLFASLNTDAEAERMTCIYKILKNFRVEKMKHSLREYEAQAYGLYEAAALPP